MYFAIDDLGIQNAMIGITKLDHYRRKHFVTLLRISKMELPYICLYAPVEVEGNRPIEKK